MKKKVEVVFSFLYEELVAWRPLKHKVVTKWRVKPKSYMLDRITLKHLHSAKKSIITQNAWENRGRTVKNCDASLLQEEAVVFFNIVQIIHLLGFTNVVVYIEVY